MLLRTGQKERPIVRRVVETETRAVPDAVLPVVLFRFVGRELHRLD